MLHTVGNVHCRKTGIQEFHHAFLQSGASWIILLSAGEDALRVGALCFSFLTNFALRPVCFVLFCCKVLLGFLFCVCLFVCLLFGAGLTKLLTGGS